jgi:hypothetical protein
MKKYACLTLLLAALLLAAGGCAGLTGGGSKQDAADSAYKTLKAAADLYDDALAAAAELHALGLIDDGQKDRIISAGDRFAEAWRAGVNALYVYALADAPDPATLEDQMALFALVYEEFSTVARPILIRALAH